MRFSLATKGIVLVAVPLLVEFLSLTWLWCAVVDADKQAQKEANARDIAAESSRIMNSFMQHGSKVVTYRIKGSANEMEHYQELRNSMRKSTQHLAELSINLSKAEQARVAVIQSRMDKALSLVGGYITEMSSPTHHPGSFDVGAFRKNLIEEIDPVRDEIKYFTDLSKTNESYGQWTDRASNQRHILLIAAVVLPNILIALGAALFYASSVRNRIKLIDQNVSRFLNGRLLGKRLKEEDEISDLDAAFHRMAEKLIAADLEMRSHYESMQTNLIEPLRSLRQVLQSSADQTSKLTEAGRTKLLKSVGTVDRLTALIEELGRLDEVGAIGLKIDISDCSLEDILSSSVTSVAEFAGKKDISVSFDCSENLTLHADFARLVQVLVNLLSNAIKFSPRDSSIKVYSEHTADAVTIHVKDEGPGISAADQSKLFQRFEQIDSIKSADIKGSGLGLSICRDIVSAHGGAIGVDSEVGSGSDFWFRIPLTTTPGA
jgi:signal transduction histidine kinase